jgi:hypothetical protein
MRALDGIRLPFALFAFVEKGMEPHFAVRGVAMAAHPIHRAGDIFLALTAEKMGRLFENGGFQEFKMNLRIRFKRAHMGK